MSTTACVVLAALAFAAGFVLARRRPALPEGGWKDEATFTTLHIAAMAAPSLRAGLTKESARRAVRHLRALLGTSALAITSTDAALAWDGACTDEVLTHARAALASGRPHVFAGEPYGAVVVPLTVEGTVVGALAAYDEELSAALVRTVTEVARWVSGQLELAELDSSRKRAMEAEMRALRAQISPHFVYNALTTIASFVRTDPDRARELILDFADFSRYALRKARDFTTLADELTCVDRYLLLERAPLRRQAALQRAGRAGGAAGARAVPVPAAAGGERHQARHARPRRQGRGQGGGPRRRPRGAHLGRGRRHGHGARARAPGARRRPAQPGQRHRAGQRGRQDAPDLRRGLRAGGRDGGGRGHQGAAAGSEGPP
ncbi:hypothetical protein FHR33_007956 [Nonomuraea dietziae]|uniref:Signal transduction histidine kinase internal region domain-containing protein n=1 Tax=Nonomuraea dietziae TaxID=65515 RepID=A0A7W5YC61_9ACTN|nr:hypothetical protein [Nonomuraea dietziae]